MATLLGSRQHKLVVLCKECHAEIEYDEIGKLPLKKVNNKLYKKAELTEKGRQWMANTFLAEDKWLATYEPSKKRKKKKRNKAKKKYSSPQENNIKTNHPVIIDAIPQAMCLPHSQYINSDHWHVETIWWNCAPELPELDFTCDEYESANLLP